VITVTASRNWLVTGPLRAAVRREGSERSSAVDWSGVDGVNKIRLWEGLEGWMERRRGRERREKGTEREAVVDGLAARMKRGTSAVYGHDELATRLLRASARR
jgi:hypothetical protein